MQKKIPFICSEITRPSSPNSEESPSIEYLFFKDGAMIQLAGIDGTPSNSFPINFIKEPNYN